MGVIVAMEGIKTALEEPARIVKKDDRRRLTGSVRLCNHWIHYDGR